MKRMAEKIALAAFICISLIFVLICLLTYFNVIPLGNGIVLEIDWALMVILLVIGVLWVIIAGYLLYVNFSQRMTLKYVMLYSDRQSSTKATSRVLRQLAVSESNQIDGVKIKKISISSNEHLGLNLKIIVEISNDDVAYSIDTLRYLLTDKYREVLGLEFAAMDFQVKKVKSNYRPDLGKAQAQATTLREKRKQCNSSICHIEASENEVGEISGDLAVPVAPQVETPSKAVETEEDAALKEQAKQQLEEQKRREFDEKLKEEKPRTMYGTPGEPPAKVEKDSDIVVEIGDDDSVEEESSQEASDAQVEQQSGETEQKDEEKPKPKRKKKD